MAAHLRSLSFLAGRAFPLVHQRVLTDGTKSPIREILRPRCKPVQDRSFKSQGLRKSEVCAAADATTQQPELVQPSHSSKQRKAAMALFAVSRVTQAFRVASALAVHLIFDIKHVCWRKAEETQQTLTQAQQSIQSAVEQPAQRMYQAESDLKAAFARLQQHAVTGGEALIRMLHSLDKPSITLDIKWRDMQEQLAGNKDVSDRLQQLYASSTESAKTVATMLAENNGFLHRSYWTSDQTKRVIDQEEELRSVVFAQMLGATS